MPERYNFALRRRNQALDPSQFRGRSAPEQCHHIADGDQPRLVRAAAEVPANQVHSGRNGSARHLGWRPLERPVGSSHPGFQRLIPDTMRHRRHRLVIDQKIANAWGPSVICSHGLIGTSIEPLPSLRDLIRHRARL